MLAELAMRARDHVYRDQFSDAGGGFRAGLGGSLDRADVAVDDDGHQPVADLLPPDDRDVGGLDHRVGGGQRSYIALGFDHAESVLCHVGLPLDDGRASRRLGPAGVWLTWLPAGLWSPGAAGASGLTYAPRAGPG